MDQQDQSPSLFEMEVDSGSQSHLLAISKWSRFISIVIFCCIALVLLSLLINAEEIMEGMALLYALENREAGIFVIVVMLVVIAFFGTWFFFLYRSSRLIKKGLYSKNSDDLAEGFKSLRISAVFYMIYSLLTILTKLGAII